MVLTRAKLVHRNTLQDPKFQMCGIEDEQVNHFYLLVATKEECIGYSYKGLPYSRGTTSIHHILSGIARREHKMEPK